MASNEGTKGAEEGSAAIAANTTAGAEEGSAALG